MQKYSRLSQVLSVSACLLVFGGGLSACRGLGEAMGDRNATLQTGQWWAGPIPDATPIKPSERTAWVAYKNVTQEQGYNLREPLRQGLVAQGYTVTDDPDKANFHVFYTLRFFGENSKADGGRTSAAVLGAIAGGVAGGGIAYGAGAGTGATIGAAAGGGLLGGVAGTAIANYSQVIEYDLIMDVRIAQRKKGTVKRTITGQQRDQHATASGGNTGGGAVAGGRASALDTNQQVQEEDNMLWQENRLVLWAKQTQLKPEEAKPSLEKAMIGALPQLLP